MDGGNDLFDFLILLILVAVAWSVMLTAATILLAIAAFAFFFAVIFLGPTFIRGFRRGWRERP